MGSPYLKDWIENARDNLPLHISYLAGGNFDKKIIHLLCDLFRQCGACTFLYTGKSKPFYIQLAKSAAAYLHFLKMAGEEQKVTSKADPFFDAISGGYLDCAHEMAQHSRMSWHASFEYEDDFLFILFLMKHFFLGADQKECAKIVTKHENISEGSDGELRDICIAFLENDSDMFANGLSILLAKRSAKIEAKIEREALSEERWAWERYISIEGLALLKLADLKDLKTSNGYLHVSDDLRKSPPISFNSNAWRTVD